MDSQMKDRIERMAYQTWETIGGDILTCMAEQELPEVMTKDQVIEAVCDASYMKTHGHDIEAYDFWNNLPTYDTKMEAVKDAFPYETYGW